MQTGERRKIDATEDFEKSKAETMEKVVTTTSIGSSIVSVNQQTFVSRSHTFDVTNRGDSSISSAMSKGHEMCISKHDDSTFESRKHDHITLLSVGDSSDTQFKAKNS